jgi:predicted nucleic acid-binding protein
MKCFIDSNVLISAGLFPGSVPAAALIKAISPPNTAFVSDYSLDEVHRKVSEKFPNKVCDMDVFLESLLFTAQLIITPATKLLAESKVSDIKDRPILRAAIFANVDVLITGDKKLLVSDVAPPPRIMKPADFLNM